MKPEMIIKVLNELEDIATSLIVIIHNDELDEAEMRVLAKGTLALCSSLQNDVITATGVSAEDAGIAADAGGE